MNIEMIGWRQVSFQHLLKCNAGPGLALFGVALSANFAWRQKSRHAQEASF
jgi:hypothetical protein